MCLYCGKLIAFLRERKIANKVSGASTELFFHWYMVTCVSIFWFWIFVMCFTINDLWVWNCICWLFTISSNQELLMLGHSLYRLLVIFIIDLRYTDQFSFFSMSFLYSYILSWLITGRLIADFSFNYDYEVQISVHLGLAFQNKLVHILCTISNSAYEYFIFRYFIFMFSW